jgi:hypothetical protein
MAGPFFIVDLSAWEGPRPNFEAIVAARDHVGCIIKATQGVTYSPSWFTENWPRVRAAGGERYGSSWFRSLYHYAEPTPSGSEQADYLLRAVDRAGGWGPGDFPPAWDLEGPKWTSRQQIVDVSSQFSERIRQQIGRAPILYTGSVWRKFNVSEKAGFTKLWTPHMDLMARVGWQNENIVLHQYVGDGKYWSPSSRPAKLGYPTGVPGLSAKVDMNVVMDGGVPASSIERVLAVLFGNDNASAVDRSTSGRGGVSVPVILGVGAGLLALGIMIASAGRDELT